MVLKEALEHVAITPADTYRFREHLGGKPMNPHGVMRGPLFDSYQAQDKAEAKGRAMPAGRRVYNSARHSSPKLARGRPCMAVIFCF
jgi:hypothetical protein